jgi:translation elongation factor EF-G
MGESDVEWSEHTKIRFAKLRDEALEKAEQEIFFSPEKNNVAFASAIDHWSFTIRSFAPRIAGKFGMNAQALEKFLWGKYYYQEMFVSLVMAPLVQQYRKFFDIDKLTNTAELKKCHLLVKEVLYKTMALEKALLMMVIENLPSPLEA